MPLMRRRRFKRRLPVRFWGPGDATPTSAHTTNISLAGMFIATREPVAPGCRVKVDLPESPEGFAFQGEVIHAARVTPNLQRIRATGMGLRLLSRGEMVAALVGRPVEDAYEERTGADPAVAGAAPGTAAIPVALRDGRSFLDLYERELRYGELFIPTPRPPALHETVRLAIEPPLSAEAPIELEARVVQSVTGVMQQLDPTRRAGMVVVFADPRRAEGRFRAICRALRDGGLSPGGAGSRAPRAARPAP